MTIPGPLARELRRVAKERRLTVSRALVSLAERGIQADRDAQKSLQTAHENFLKAQERGKKEQAGKALVSAIFGSDAIAEDSLF